MCFAPLDLWKPVRAKTRGGVWPRKAPQIISFGVLFKGMSRMLQVRLELRGPNLLEQGPANWALGTNLPCCLHLSSVMGTHRLVYVLCTAASEPLAELSIGTEMMWLTYLRKIWPFTGSFPHNFKVPQSSE